MVGIAHNQNSDWWLMLEITNITSVCVGGGESKSHYCDVEANICNAYIHRVKEEQRQLVGGVGRTAEIVTQPLKVW